MPLRWRHVSTSPRRTVDLPHVLYDLRAQNIEQWPRQYLCLRYMLITVRDELQQHPFSSRARTSNPQLRCDIDFIIAKGKEETSWQTGGRDARLRGSASDENHSRSLGVVDRDSTE